MDQKLCARCFQPVERKALKYCERCGPLVIKERDEKRRAARRRGCERCGKPNEGRGSRLCESCRTERLPVWQQAEQERERQKRAQEAVVRPAKADIPEGHKYCSRCQTIKPLQKFSGKGGNGSSYCVVCSSAYTHSRRLETTYGITAEDYARMLQDQGGKCAICDKKPVKRRLSVDHNHKTGAVRGLLCTRCNHKLLGSANEDVTILRRAADYLEKYLTESPVTEFVSHVQHLNPQEENGIVRMGDVSVVAVNASVPTPEWIAWAGEGSGIRFIALSDQKDEWKAVAPLDVHLDLLAKAGYLPERLP